MGFSIGRMESELLYGVLPLFVWRGEVGRVGMAEGACGGGGGGGCGGVSVCGGE